MAVPKVPKNWIKLLIFSYPHSFFFTLFYKLTLCKLAFIMIFSHRGRFNSTTIKPIRFFLKRLLKSQYHIDFHYCPLWILSIPPKNVKRNLRWTSNQIDIQLNHLIQSKCVLQKKKTEENIFIVKLGIFHVTVGVCHLWADGCGGAVVCVFLKWSCFHFSCQCTQNRLP